MFATTRWTVVLNIADQDSSTAQEALEQLFITYWNPLYSYVRRQGYNPHDAQDLTQSFFERSLETDFLTKARKERGRFRNFLLTAMRRHLINAHRHRSATKRGGQARAIPWDETEAEAEYLKEKENLNPELLYEKKWAITVIQEVIRKLEQEHDGQDRAGFFADCVGIFFGEGTDLPIKEIAQRYGMTEGAAKVAMHRLRARYRKLLRNEIAQTVDCIDDIEDEIRHLVRALSR